MVITQHQPGHPYYLEIAKTLNKSEYYMDKYIKINYNVSGVKEVQGKELYAFLLKKEKEKLNSAETHRGLVCIEPEKNYF